MSNPTLTIYYSQVNHQNYKHFALNEKHTSYKWSFHKENKKLIFDNSPINLAIQWYLLLHQVWTMLCGRSLKCWITHILFKNQSHVSNFQPRYEHLLSSLLVSLINHVVIEHMMHLTCHCCHFMRQYAIFELCSMKLELSLVIVRQILASWGLYHGNTFLWLRGRGVH